MKIKSKQIKRECPKPGRDIISEKAQMCARETSKPCDRCGMHHLTYHLAKVGYTIYGTNSIMRNERFSHWFKNGTSSYIDVLNKQIKFSRLGQMLQPIVSRSSNNVKYWSAEKVINEHMKTQTQLYVPVLV